MFYVESITIGNSSFVARIWERIQTYCEIIGYSRAASHLASMGLHKQAKECMMQVAKLKS
jgi:hypothetical protein